MIGAASAGLRHLAVRKGRELWRGLAVVRSLNGGSRVIGFVLVLEGGPLAGRRIEADVVEGRPPRTIDVDADDGSTCRYCLAEWVQAGPSAVYTFLYPV